ncbi:ARG82 (YDR173C) [Zygosaccharomyces parabailii]|nr:ARG82 (YDR173C) [Zygosaccharomyces parabailii]CDH10494.1 related to Inositol polyphosphate multikinase [Zygosaccharomyces bailii ISA1307]
MIQHKLLKHKAAGHDGTLTDDDELLVFKPATTQELDFYKSVQERTFNNTRATDGDVPLYSWMPTFLGVLDEGLREVPESACAISSEKHIGDQAMNKSSKCQRSKYIVLENLLHGFHKPNIMDVKLGKILHDENASNEKMSRLGQVSRTTTSGSLGFRICGMKIQHNKQAGELESSHFEQSGDGYIFVNKNFGYSLKKQNIKDAFKMYFANDSLSPRRVWQLKHTFLQRLQLLYNTLLEEEVRMVSSSLFFVYEGDNDRWDALDDQDTLIRDSFLDSDEESEDDEEQDLQKTPLSSLSLIDFAHSKLVDGKGYDENVVDAVENMMELFQDLCN